jgi:hypothetical protein
MTLTLTKAHNQCMPTLVIIPHSLQKYGHSDPELVYTANVRANKPELERAFPSLLDNVLPVPALSLDTLKLPTNWEVFTLTSTYQINTWLNSLMEDLSDLLLESKLHIALDIEWSVDRTHSIHGHVALISLGFEKCIYLIPVCFFHFISYALLMTCRLLHTSMKMGS